jgi:hypothetical protein
MTSVERFLKEMDRFIAALFKRKSLIDKEMATSVSFLKHIFVTLLYKTA